MKIQKTISAAVTSISLVVGLSGAVGATTGSITDTGPHSVNKIKSTNSTHVNLHNTNNLGVNNANSQTAYSGDAKAFDNTTAGGAMSGAAGNTNGTNVSANVNNSASASAWSGVVGSGSGDNSATIATTGPHSVNKVEFKDTTHVNVTNNNNVSVSNSNSQSATSGDAKVFDNTTGGSATSGAASNSNSTSVNLSVSN